MKLTYTLWLILAGVLLFEGCGNNENVPKPVGVTLSAFEQENGVGPVKEKITLAAVDKKNVEKGSVMFEQKCFSCHRLDTKLVGPALRQVTKRRTPEYILNMILNPEEMTKRHPVAKQLLAEHLTQMTFQNVTRDDAMLILDYLRSEADKPAEAPAPAAGNAKK